MDGHHLDQAVALIQGLGKLVGLSEGLADPFVVKALLFQLCLVEDSVEQGFT
jgi:hypothetical protein